MQTQDRILDAHRVNDLSFANLTSYFNKHEQHDVFKGLVGLRSMDGNKAKSTGAIHVNQRTNMCSYNGNVYRRGNNSKPCSTYGKWGHSATICHIGKPCPR